MLLYTYKYGHDELLSSIVRVLLGFVMMRLIADLIPCCCLDERGKSGKKEVKVKKIKKLSNIFENFENTMSSINPPPTRKNSSKINL